MTANTTTQTHKFSISYDFDSTSDHRIDAQELGNGLVNLALAIQEGDKILNGEDSDISVDVIANRPGSFEIELITQAIANHKDIIQVLGISVSAASVGIGSVLGALKAYQNRKVEIEQQLEDGSWQVTFEDGESTTVTDEVKSLVNNYNFRKKIDGALNRPASSSTEGSVKFFESDDSGKQLTNEVSIDETTYFKAPPKKSLSSETIEEEITNIRFTNVALESRTGWKMRLPDDSVVPVTIDDEGFLERINTRSNAVIKNDLFEVKLRTVVKETNGKTTTSRSIIRVIRHRVDSSRKLIADDS